MTPDRQYTPAQERFASVLAVLLLLGVIVGAIVLWMYADHRACEQDVKNHTYGVQDIGHC